MKLGELKINKEISPVNWNKCIKMHIYYRRQKVSSVKVYEEHSEGMRLLKKYWT